MTAPARVAVLTTAHGRHQHLRRLVAGLAAGTRRPDLQVVVAMADDEIAAVMGDLAPPWPVVVVDVGGAPDELPLARARNRAAHEARERGADLLVFLDVDCVPGAHLVERYAQVAEAEGHGPRLLCGTVHYLPELAPGEDYDLGDLGASSRPHPARPDPGADEVVRDGDLLLFWSLSFAVTADDLASVGGFDERYVGYGGEDTDLAMAVGARGGALWWVGGADAYHQHHDSETPPVRHAVSIARNANLFHSRWGWYPMQGWLHALAERGLLEQTPDGWRPVRP